MRIKGDISLLALEQFINEMEKVAKEAYKVLGVLLACFAGKKF